MAPENTDLKPSRNRQVEGVVFQPPLGDVAFAVVSGSEQTLKVELKVPRESQPIFFPLTSWNLLTYFPDDAVRTARSAGLEEN